MYLSHGFGIRLNCSRELSSFVFTRIYKESKSGLTNAITTNPFVFDHHMDCITLKQKIEKERESAFSYLCLFIELSLSLWAQISVVENVLRLRAVVIHSVSRRRMTQSHGKQTCSNNSLKDWSPMLSW